MWENIAIKAIHHLLSEWLEDVPKVVSTEITSGRVSYSNLRLKKSLLTNLGVKADILFGEIGLLKLNISWQSLVAMNPEVDIEVEDVYIFVNRSLDNHMINEEGFVKEVTTSGAKLISARQRKDTEVQNRTSRYLKADSEQDGDAAAGSSSWVSQLLHRTLNRSTASIKNLHISYVDAVTGLVVALHVPMVKLKYADVPSGIMEAWRTATGGVDTATTPIYKALHINEVKVRCGVHPCAKLDDSGYGSRVGSFLFFFVKHLSKESNVDVKRNTVVQFQEELQSPRLYWLYTVLRLAPFVLTLGEHFHLQSLSIDGRIGSEESQDGLAADGSIKMTLTQNDLRHAYLSIRGYQAEMETAKDLLYSNCKHMNLDPVYLRHFTQFQYVQCHVRDLYHQTYTTAAEEPSGDSNDSLSSDGELESDSDFLSAESEELVHAGDANSFAATAKRRRELKNSLSVIRQGIFRVSGTTSPTEELLDEIRSASLVKVEDECCSPLTSEERELMRLYNDCLPVKQLAQWRCKAEGAFLRLQETTAKAEDGVSNQGGNEAVGWLTWWNNRSSVTEDQLNDEERKFLIEGAENAYLNLDATSRKRQFHFRLAFPLLEVIVYQSGNVALPLDRRGLLAPLAPPVLDCQPDWSRFVKRVTQGGDLVGTHSGSWLNLEEAPVFRLITEGSELSLTSIPPIGGGPSNAFEMLGFVRGDGDDDAAGIDDSSPESSEGDPSPRNPPAHAIDHPLMAIGLPSTGPLPPFGNSEERDPILCISLTMTGTTCSMSSYTETPGMMVLEAGTVNFRKEFYSEGDSSGKINMRRFSVATHHKDNYVLRMSDGVSELNNGVFIEYRIYSSCNKITEQRPPYDTAIIVHLSQSEVVLHVRDILDVMEIVKTGIIKTFLLSAADKAITAATATFMLFSIKMHEVSVRLPRDMWTIPQWLKGRQSFVRQIALERGLGSEERGRTVLAKDIIKDPKLARYFPDVLLDYLNPNRSYYGLHPYPPGGPAALLDDVYRKHISDQGEMKFMSRSLEFRIQYDKDERSKYRIVCDELTIHSTHTALNRIPFDLDASSDRSGTIYNQQVLKPVKAQLTLQVVNVAGSSPGAEPEYQEPPPSAASREPEDDHKRIALDGTFSAIEMDLSNAVLSLLLSVVGENGSGKAYYPESMAASAVDPAREVAADGEDAANERRSMFRRIFKEQSVTRFSLIASFPVLNLSLPMHFPAPVRSEEPYEYITAEDLESPGGCVARLTINTGVISLDVQSHTANNTMFLQFDGESYSLIDLRKNTPNVYKKILAQGSVGPRCEAMWDSDIDTLNISKCLRARTVVPPYFVSSVPTSLQYPKFLRKPGMNGRENFRLGFMTTGCGSCLYVRAERPTLSVLPTFWMDVISFFNLSFTCSTLRYYPKRPTPVADVGDELGLLGTVFPINNSFMIDIQINKAQLLLSPLPTDPTATTIILKSSAGVRLFSEINGQFTFDKIDLPSVSVFADDTLLPKVFEPMVRSLNLRTARNVDGVPFPAINSFPKLAGRSRKLSRCNFHLDLQGWMTTVYDPTGRIDPLLLPARSADQQEAFLPGPGPIYTYDSLVSMVGLNNIHKAPVSELRLALSVDAGGLRFCGNAYDIGALVAAIKCLSAAHDGPSMLPLTRVPDTVPFNGSPTLYTTFVHATSSGKMERFESMQQVQPYPSTEDLPASTVETIVPTIRFYTVHFVGLWDIKVDIEDRVVIKDRGATSATPWSNGVKIPFAQINVKISFMSMKFAPCASSITIPQGGLGIEVYNTLKNSHEPILEPISFSFCRETCIVTGVPYIHPPVSRDPLPQDSVTSITSNSVANINISSTMLFTMMDRWGLIEEDLLLYLLALQQMPDSPPAPCIALFSSEAKLIEFLDESRTEAAARPYPTSTNPSLSINLLGIDIQSAQPSASSKFVKELAEAEEDPESWMSTLIPRREGLAGELMTKLRFSRETQRTTTAPKGFDTQRQARPDESADKPVPYHRLLNLSGYTIHLLSKELQHVRDVPPSCYLKSMDDVVDRHGSTKGNWRHVLSLHLGKDQLISHIPLGDESCQSISPAFKSGDSNEPPDITFCTDRLPRVLTDALEHISASSGGGPSLQSFSPSMRLLLRCCSACGSGVLPRKHRILSETVASHSSYRITTLGSPVRLQNASLCHLEVMFIDLENDLPLFVFDRDHKVTDSRWVSLNPLSSLGQIDNASILNVDGDCWKEACGQWDYDLGQLTAVHEEQRACNLPLPLDRDLIKSPCELVDMESANPFERFIDAFKTGQDNWSNLHAEDSTRPTYAYPTAVERVAIRRKKAMSVTPFDATDEITFRRSAAVRDLEDPNSIMERYLLERSAKPMLLPHGHTLFAPSSVIDHHGAVKFRVRPVSFGATQHRSSCESDGDLGFHNSIDPLITVTSPPDLRNGWSIPIVAQVSKRPESTNATIVAANRKPFLNPITQTLEHFSNDVIHLDVNVTTRKTLPPAISRICDVVFSAPLTLVNASPVTLDVEIGHALPKEDLKNSLRQNKVRVPSSELSSLTHTKMINPLSISSPAIHQIQSDGNSGLLYAPQVPESLLRRSKSTLAATTSAQKKLAGVPQGSFQLAPLSYTAVHRLAPHYLSEEALQLLKLTPSVQSYLWTERQSNSVTTLEVGGVISAFSIQMRIANRNAPNPWSSTALIPSLRPKSTQLGLLRPSDLFSSVSFPLESATSRPGFQLACDPIVIKRFVNSYTRPSTSNAIPLPPLGVMEYSSVAIISASHWAIDQSNQQISFGESEVEHLNSQLMSPCFQVDLEGTHDRIHLLPNQYYKTLHVAKTSILLPARIDDLDAEEVTNNTEHSAPIRIYALHKAPSASPSYTPLVLPSGPSTHMPLIIKATGGMVYDFIATSFDLNASVTAGIGSKVAVILPRVILSNRTPFPLDIIPKFKSARDAVQSLGSVVTADTSTALHWQNPSKVTTDSLPDGFQLTPLKPLVKQGRLGQADESPPKGLHVRSWLTQNDWALINNFNLRSPVLSLSEERAGKTSVDFVDKTTKGLSLTISVNTTFLNGSLFIDVTEEKVEVEEPKVVAPTHLANSIQIVHIAQISVAFLSDRYREELILLHISPFTIYNTFNEMHQVFAMSVTSFMQVDSMKDCSTRQVLMATVPLAKIGTGSSVSDSQANQTLSKGKRKKVSRKSSNLSDELTDYRSQYKMFIKASERYSATIRQWFYREKSCDTSWTPEAMDYIADRLLGPNGDLEHRVGLYIPVNKNASEDRVFFVQWKRNYIPGDDTQIDLEGLTIHVSKLEIDFDDVAITSSQQLFAEMEQKLSAVAELTRHEKLSFQAFCSRHLSSPASAQADPIPRIDPNTKLSRVLSIKKFTATPIMFKLWCKVSLNKLSMVEDVYKNILRLLTLGQSLEVNGAPVSLRPPSDRLIRGNLSVLLTHMAKHYLTELTGQLGTGIITYTTATNIPKYPVEVLRRGIGFGLSTFDTAATNLSSLLNVMMMDAEYIEGNQNQRSAAPEGQSDSLSGMKNAGKNILEGMMAVTDVFQQPVKGAKEEGIKGFFSGLAKGAVGTILKPVDKINQALQNVAVGVNQDLKRVVESKHVIVRRRKARIMWGTNGIVTKWTLGEALLRESLGTQKASMLLDHITVHRLDAYENQIHHITVLIFSDSIYLYDLNNGASPYTVQVKLSRDRKQAKDKSNNNVLEGLEGLATEAFGVIVFNSSPAEQSRTASLERSLFGRARIVWGVNIVNIKDVTLSDRGVVVKLMDKLTNSFQLRHILCDDLDTAKLVYGKIAKARASLLRSDNAVGTTTMTDTDRSA
eukprot:GHVH01002562.1.p1 GENE.GHVH01002562.1~~GHVH01002562.1.p1  ORF type:complete len:3792 (+),score=544.54 GHVH01002562.1:211-11586(+)